MADKVIETFDFGGIVYTASWNTIALHEPRIRWDGGDKGGVFYELPNTNEHRRFYVDATRGRIKFLTRDHAAHWCQKRSARRAA